LIRKSGTRNLLTVVDVYLRKVLEQLLQHNIRKADVFRILRKVHIKILILHCKQQRKRAMHGRQPDRNMLTNGDIPEKADNPASSNSFSIISLFLDASKNSSQAVLTELNSWDNSVQLIGG
jgi:hypothetical protein